MGSGQVRIAVFCSGFGSNLEALLRAEKKHRLGGRIALVVSDNPAAYALDRAKRHSKQVFLFMPAHYDSRESYETILIRFLKEQKISWIILAGFMRILTPVFIKAFAGRMLNIHPSLLPAFKGAHAIRDAFESGVSRSGVTVHFVTDAVDGGPVILQKPVKRLKGDTLKIFEERIHKAEHRLYAQAVRLAVTGRVNFKSASGRVPVLNPA